ncbi:MAG: hypothetical protein FWG90_00475 [Oscillospiraceae bacterium]|nr:hypothetical protein [Oscillospiraceae bacterium]
MKKPVIFLLILSFIAMLCLGCGNNNGLEDTLRLEIEERDVEEPPVNKEFLKMAMDFLQMDEEQFAEQLYEFYTNLSPEFSAKFEEMSRSIYINNSRFALPMMVSDLPQGFTVALDEFNDDLEQGFDGMVTESTTLYFNDEQIGHAAIVRAEDETFEDGIIIGLVSLPPYSKASIGELRGTPSVEEVKAVFGESVLEEIFDPWLIYMSVSKQNFGFLMFATNVGGFLVFNIEGDPGDYYSIVEKARQNAEFIEYHPYDDFDNMPLIILSGEPRKLEWVNAPDNIIIGDEKYPMVLKVKDLSDNFALTPFGVGKPFYGPNQEFAYIDCLRDNYIVTYMGRELGFLHAFRHKDELPENALGSFTFPNRKNLPFPAGILGIPVNADIGEVEKIYIPDSNREEGFRKLSYGGLLTDNGKEYFFNIFMLETTFSTRIIPLEIDPQAYENWLESLNEE